MIRRASQEDVKSLSKLFDLYRQFYKQKSDLEAAEKFLKDRLKNSESVIFVAETDDKTKVMAGFVQLYPTFSSIGMKPIWILNDLFVDPSVRGAGFGKKLLKAAETFSLESGSRNLMLQTARTNVSAQALYEKQGWKKDEDYFTYYFFH